MSVKPHFRVIANRPVEVNRRESPVESARRRFGQRFAHEPGATWQPKAVPVLTAWMQSRGK